MKLKRIEKAILCGFLITVITATASGFSAFAQQCDDIRGRVLRLHILANSDSSADQALKLKVRDKILACSGELFGNAPNKAQAEAQAKANLAKIQQVAQDEVKAEGYSYPVKAMLTNMYFTTRTYGDVTLPAGDYDAVRVTIGSAQGHNWWCVLFPPLCLPAAQGQSTKKLSDVLNGDEVGVVTSGSQTTVIKFKVVEWYESARNFFSSLGKSQTKAAPAKKASATKVKSKANIWPRSISFY